METQTPNGDGRSRERQSQSRLTVSEMRGAILDVIDGGCDCAPDTGRHAPWMLDDSDQDFANRQRLSFADAVIRRLREIKK